MPRKRTKYAAATIELVLAVVISPWMQQLLIAQTTPASLPNDTNISSEAWRVSVSPYLWMAGMNSLVAFGGHAVQVDQSFSDIFHNLKFGIMGLSEVRRKRTGVITDLIYIRLGDETAKPVEGLASAIDVKTSLDTFTLTPYLSYRIVGADRGSIDILSGGRYYHIGATISAEESSSGHVSFSTSDHWADFVEGGRFRLNLTPRIGAFFIGDAGVGGSELTWQIVGGIGYKWSKRWSTELGYRRLYFDRRTGNDLHIEVTEQGLLLGLTFRL